jgi:hypothetical protein
MQYVHDSPVARNFGYEKTLMRAKMDFFLVGSTGPGPTRYI